MCYQTDKPVGCVWSTETTRNHIGMHGRSNAIVMRYGAKKQGKEQEQHIEGTEKTLSKSCSTTGDQNYEHNSSGSPGSSTEQNFLRSGRFFWVVLQ
ncbi:hypothetical protein TNCV_1543801 [Trichonephila clavipes]|nr:hypothetical protein TNCV_1543801 [Trichonephila clavipes]